MSLKNNNIFEFESFQINLEEKTLWHGDERISLAPRVFETLEVLLENRGRLMTKDELMDEIWGETFVEEKNLSQNIFRLRKEFKKRRKDAKFIETIPRRGYKFIADVKPVEIIQNEEKSLAVNHKKSLQITAEGSVSKQELTDVVTEITKDIISNGNTNLVQPKQIEAKKSRSSFLNSKIGIAFGVLSVLLFASFVWAWQNNYLNFRKTGLAGNIDVANLKFERITDSGNAFFPAISPDKQFLAYVKNEDSKFSILLKNIASGSETVVVSPKDYEIRSPQFSKDGSYLFYGARDGKMETTVYKVPIFGGTSEEIITNVNQNFSISNNGEKIAFFRNAPKIGGNKLMICDIDGKNENVIAEKKDGKVFRVWASVPGWSPDDKKLAVVLVETIPQNEESTLNRPTLLEIEVENGNEKLIKTPDWENIVYAKWTSSENYLVVLAQDKPEDFSKLYRLSYESGEANLLTNDTDNYKEFAVAPNDEFIFATEERNPYNLQFIPVDKPLNIRSLTDSTRIKYGSRGIAWTPDGEFLVYTKAIGNSSIEIWKSNVETFEQTRLTFDKTKKNQHPSIAANGNRIYFSSNESGENQIWSMDFEGSDKKQLTNEKGGATFPRISPDGKWILYATPALKPNTLWKQSVVSGEKLELLPFAGGKSYISPDMKTIIASYYDPDEKEKDPWKYIFIPFDNKGKPSETKTFKHTYDLSWSPDGKGIYFVTIGQSHSNINYFSLAGETITPITNYDSQSIFQLKISPNGKTIAAARGKRSSNLIKIAGF